MPARLRTTLLVAAIAAALAGCGSDDDGTIPQENAENLLAQLAAVEDSIAAGDCEDAAARADDLVTLVNDLPADVGVETKEGLRNGAVNLVALAAEQCEPSGATGETGVEPTTTDETEPTTTTTTTTEEATTDEDDEDQPAPEDEEQPSEEEPPPAEEQPPSDQGPGGGQGDGGEPPSGGLGPGGEGR